MNDLLMALWFFLPAGIANMTPIFAAQLPVIKNWSAPLDFGLKFRGQRIFGDHKTWRGLSSGLITGVLVLWLQTTLYAHSDWIQGFSSLDYSNVSIIGLGLLLGFGALGGDALKSFFKRQIGVKSGRSWFPFDQLDYVIGGLLLSAILVQLTLAQYVLIIAIWFGLHLLTSYIGYLLKLKDQPI